MRARTHLLSSYPLIVLVPTYCRVDGCHAFYFSNLLFNAGTGSDVVHWQFAAGPLSAREMVYTISTDD